jgi:tetratricopeptide (TPR) repeat protein
MKHTFAQQLLKQGIAASRAGQSQDAKRLLRQALELDPDSESAWLWLSGVVDSLSERQHCLEQVLRLNPGNAHARAGLAWIEQQAIQASPPAQVPSDPVGAESQPDRETGTGSFCPFCNRPVSAYTTTCHHCHHSLIVTCPACETQLDVEEATCNVCDYQLGDYRKGAPYYAALGDAYLTNRKADLAIAAWQKVLDMDANYPDAYLRLGEARAIAGDWDGAHATLEQATRQATNPVTIHLSLGRIYEKRHQWDEAQNAYEQAVVVDERSADARFALGRLLMEGKALQAAFPHIRRATELAPEHTGAWFLLGQLYEVAQESRRAIQAYERASAVTAGASPDDSEWHQRALERLELLRPSLPSSVALEWPETVRQTAGMVLIPVLAALVNAGLRPWQIAPLDYVGVLVATLGAYFWISASTSPRNPGMRAMLGQDGLSQPMLRTSMGVLGGLFWTTGLLYVLLAPVLV